MTVDDLGSVVVAGSMATGIVVQAVRGDNIWVGIAMGFAVPILLAILFASVYSLWKGVTRSRANKRRLAMEAQRHAERRAKWVRNPYE